MRASSVMKLLSTFCGGFLVRMPGALVDATKMFYDYRPPGDFETEGTNCADALAGKTRYIQVEVFDYNFSPWIKATYTKIAGECGETNFEPFSKTMEYNGYVEGNITDRRLQMDMYICAPWGEYELVVEVKSANDGNKMEKVAWEVEYGPDEYHIWDTLNTPLFGEAKNFREFTANGPLPSDYPYAPIPDPWDGEGPGTTYIWPLPGSEGYYSLLYTGPFPPTKCPNLYPEGVEYEGCYDASQPGWTTAVGPQGIPTDSKNDVDDAERFRMFDGIAANNDGGDGGVGEDGVMTLEKCWGICRDGGYPYLGLGSTIKVNYKLVHGNAPKRTPQRFLTPL